MARLCIIRVFNKQGASDEKDGLTRKEVNSWLQGWSDPQELQAKIYDEMHNLVGHKPFGRKNIIWGK